MLRVVDALDAAIQLLADDPGIGHLRPDFTPQDVRFWSVFRYLVIYRPDTKPLEIVACCTASVTFDGCSKTENALRMSSASRSR